MSFKLLEIEKMKQILEKEEDILTPAFLKQADFYKNTECPNCGSKDLKQDLNKRSLNEILPRYYFECAVCGCKFDPHSSLIHKDGTKNISTTALTPTDQDTIHISDLVGVNPQNDKL